jgi:hypothetical protein
MVVENELLSLEKQFRHERDDPSWSCLRAHRRMFIFLYRLVPEALSWVIHQYRKLPAFPIKTHYYPAFAGLVKAWISGVDGGKVLCQGSTMIQ